MDDVDEVHSNAGVICYAIVNEEPVFILGREQFVKGWNGSLKWSEFGGHSKDHEVRDARITATREFFEETMGVFGPIDDLLTHGQYNFHLTMKRGRPYETFKVYYFMQVPWIENYREMFHQRRDQLKQIVQMTGRIRDLQRVISQERLPIPDYPYRLNSGFSIILDINALTKNADGWVINVDACASEGTAYFKWNPTTATKCNSSIKIPEIAVPMYERIMDMKKTLDAMVAQNGTLLSAIYFNASRPWLPFVHREYLEKDDINAWTLDEIKTTKSMRAGFSATLKLCLESILSL